MACGCACRLRLNVSDEVSIAWTFLFALTRAFSRSQAPLIYIHSFKHQRNDQHLGLVIQLSSNSLNFLLRACGLTNLLATSISNSSDSGLCIWVSFMRLVSCGASDLHASLRIKVGLRSSLISGFDGATASMHGISCDDCGVK